MKAMSKTYTLDARAVAMDRERIAVALGYPTPEAVSARVRDSLPALIGETVDRADPKAAVLIGAVREVRVDVIQIADGPAFHGRLLAKAIEPATKAALFALTIGQKITDWITELSERDIWTSFIVDAIASELVESLADHLQDRVAEELRAHNLFCGLRYSPGYCDWPIGELPTLLSHVGSERIGISLTEGGMMVPKKSIAGLIGFGQDADAVRFNPCDECPRTDCDHRRSTEDMWGDADAPRR